MINLLPPQQKKELLQEENWKLLLIWGVLILSFLLCLILILLSLKIYISGQADLQKILFTEEEQKFEVSEAQNFEKKINSVNQNLSKLNSFYQSQIHLTKLLERIAGTLPQRLYLTSLSYSPPPQKEKYSQISLAGYAPTREVLFEFKKNLEAEKSITEIYFPPSNWIESVDIDFHTTFKITNN